MTRRHRRAKPKFVFKIPFLDRGRPSSPYVDHSHWSVQKHDPLPPFGEGYKILHRRGPAALSQMREEQLPQSIYCLDNQPPGPEPPENAPRLEIEFVKELRSQLAYGSQVMECRIVGGSLDEMVPSASSSQQRHWRQTSLADDRAVVAKIFDPLYYYHNGLFDIAELADMEYCREAAAYTHLKEAGMDGRWLPKYLGSYTLDVPLTEDQQYFLAQYKGTDHPLLQPAVPVRRVRLILIEKVVGEAMTHQLVFGDVNGLPDEMRLDTIASTLEAYAHLYFYGVVHGDLAPRNVFLRDESEQSRGPTANPPGAAEPTLATGIQRKRPLFHRFVDLGLAYVLGTPISAYPRQPTGETRPRNPISLFWNVFDSGAVNLYYWFPHNMRNTASFQRWMLRRWYGDSRFESVGAVPVPVAKDEAWGVGGKDETADDVVAASKIKSREFKPCYHEVVSKAMAMVPAIKNMVGWQHQANRRSPAKTMAPYPFLEHAEMLESPADKPLGFW